MDKLVISSHGNVECAKEFINSLEKSQFNFCLVISYTETSEIPGITIAGADKEFLKFTSPADAEFLRHGHCKCIDTIPMSPDGKPTPALLTKVALDSAKIPHFIINAGSKISPNIPHFDSQLEFGKNISESTALSPEKVSEAVEFGKIIGKSICRPNECLVIGESIPGGTTTALAVLNGFGINTSVSSSMPNNPIEIKNQAVDKALKRLESDDPINVISELGDPMIPVVAGILSESSKITHVILAGGTQMTAVLAFAKRIGYNQQNIAVGCTSYIIDDVDAKFLETIKQIDDIPVLSVDPLLSQSKFPGLKSYSEGFVKEGAGAGGCMIASLLKTRMTSDKLLELIEKEYERISNLKLA
ncbi:MAG: TIGR00303 family protein [Candidatus Nitrosopelagicus sp.]|nr:TIGR00303 family protein [Candidatus Nitrosopelagicus sp.]